MIGIQRAAGRCEAAEDPLGTALRVAARNHPKSFAEIRRRRMPTVTGVRICMYPIESTGNREEEWYRAGFLLVAR